MTWVSLFVLILLFPIGNSELVGDTSEVLKNLNEGLRIVVLVMTVLSLWTIFLLLWISTYRENTPLSGIGLKKLRLVDFAWGISFQVAAFAILTGLGWLLAQVGLPMSGDVALLIPQDTTGRLIWVGVSFTAGFCEEVAFRGYLMTRIRLLFKLDNWVIPTLVSAFVFGICHSYQGIPGMIMIGTYGLLFALLYIRTGSLWPCIIAHFSQDLLALFIPQ